MPVHLETLTVTNFTSKECPAMCQRLRASQPQPKQPLIFFGTLFGRPSPTRQCHARAVLKPQSSVLIIAERGEVKVVQNCAHASSAQVRKVHVLMLPSFMKGGDIFLLYLGFLNVAWVIRRPQACLQRCGVFFSHTPNEAKASAVMTSTISS